MLRLRQRRRRPAGEPFREAGGGDVGGDPTHTFMIIASWNIRGLTDPVKQLRVQEFMVNNKVKIMGILETKLKREPLDFMMRNSFTGWLHCNNLGEHPKGRILILWRPGPVDVDVVCCHSQLIHLRVTCKVTSQVFLVAYVYGLHSKVARRDLWAQLRGYTQGRVEPWIVLGDFNSVMRSEERRGGQPVTPYQVNDLAKCCLATGLTDISSSGFFYT